jgi:alkylhydroperoxidase/carboxymuconolactone decarboxylase family protein YurZ
MNRTHSDLEIVCVASWEARNSTEERRERRQTLSEQSSETPVLDLITTMTAASIEATTLDADTAMLVRIAALVAVDAPPASYVMNLGAAAELGIGEDEVRAVLTAIAPIVGTTKVVSATGNILRALGFALEMAEMEAADE